MGMFPSLAGCEMALKKALAAESPSTSAKSQEYRKYQCNSPIYDGRYDAKNPTDTIALPIQLFHPVFAHFLDDIMNQYLPVPEHILRVTVEYIWNLSAIYESEDQWMAAHRSLLEDALGVTILKWVNVDASKPDGVYEAELRGSQKKVFLVLLEHKNELGDGRCDPPRQADLSFTQFVAQVMCVFTTVTNISYSLTCFSHSTISCRITVAVRPS